MLADPAQARAARQRAFQHRRRVHEHAVTERADLRGDAVGQSLQAVAHQLVVVAAQRVAGHVGALPVGEGGPGLVLVAPAVVQAHRDHPQRAGHQLGRARALVAVARHPLHRAVQAPGQPVAQVGLVLAQFHAADAEIREHLLEILMLNIRYISHCFSL